MNKAVADKLHSVKRCIAAMIEERDSPRVDSVFKVNALWQNFGKYMGYIRDLPIEHLENIRAHTGMAFFANVWHNDYHDGRRIKSDEEALKHPLIQRYLSHAKDLPDKFLCSEPCTNSDIAQIGIKFQGRLINHDTVRDQACVANLYNLGLLGPLETKRSVIVELGSGYGQLAHQLVRGLGKGCAYVCVDVPESLFWSSVFLTVNNDPGSIYIYDPAEGEHVDLNELAARYQFIMLPNYMRARLQELKTIDLVINNNSLQEMSESQAQDYLELFSRILTGWIYSYNANRQFMNFELKTPIFEMLAKYFKGWPHASFYDEFYKGVEHKIDPKFLFVGHRKDRPAPARSTDASGVILISGRRAVLDFGAKPAG